MSPKSFHVVGWHHDYLWIGISVSKPTRGLSPASRFPRKGDLGGELAQTNTPPAARLLPLGGNLFFDLSGNRGRLGGLPIRDVYLIVGAHAIHSGAALMALAWAWVRLDKGRLTGSELATVSAFWYFVVLVWPVLYVKVYL